MTDINLDKPVTLRDLNAYREEIGKAFDQMGSTMKGFGERLSEVEKLAAKAADTVTKTAETVTEVSRQVSHVTDQHGILRESVEKTHKHMAEQLATALGATRVPA